MELYLNEFSVDGQFESVEEFRKYIVSGLKPIMDRVIERKIPVKKKQDMYAHKITSDQSLHDILMHSTNDPIMSILRSYIINLGYEKPYWDDSPKSKSECEYTYIGKSVEPNCFTEAIECGGILLSLPHDKYKDTVFCCKKDGQEVSVHNVLDLKSLLDVMLEESMDDIDYVLENYPLERKIVLALAGGRCYAKEALLECGLDKKDYIHILEKLAIMIEGLKSGDENPYWKKIKEDIFEFRINVSQQRIFRLFFVQQKENIIFLNGFIKKSQTTPKLEKEKAIRIAKMIKDV